MEVEQGGIELIRVVDDGHGIAPDDLPMALASHATSKLTSADDLFQIATLGFRGEALASIGGVAQVTLQSRQADQAVGAEISCSGSVLSPVRPWNGPTGTRIEARHLFYNTPVRRKFLRTISTEMGHISEMFTRVALPQTGLHMTLRHDGREVYEVAASTGLQERLTSFFGAELRDKLYDIDVRGGPARLHGFVADPSFDRGNARMQYLFLNGRWIRDRSLGHALQEAYRGLLMTGRYAVAFLFLEMPPDLVDVNVHPTKSEVRFRDGHGLYSLVLNAIRSRLRQANLTPRLQPPSTLGQPQVANFTPAPIFDEPDYAPPLPSGPDLADRAAAVGSTSSVDTRSGLPDAASVVNAIQKQLLVEQPNSFKAIQLYNAYLVLETAEGMLVIDQHALHERILFEQLKKRVRSRTLEVQQLLIPEPVELSAEQAATTLEHRQDLADLGLGIEDFGGGTLLVTSYPAMLGKRSPQAILKAVVDHLASKERVPTREQLLNDLLSLMACHSAVRSGDPLTSEEIAALVAQRNLADDTHHCPHGRPTSLLFTRHDLDRQFRRV